jgi:hypothetical protein
MSDDYYIVMFFIALIEISSIAYELNGIRRALEKKELK